eukprot:CAMPEP_0204643398 /NCGR_PEP_ID=MMETSP0718-20130828/679_1 /ASSEMBLY_ACC=CAM_ASM_000674 /TAXON_ID=230516 /ORGANISM="Chaetoceros curvisetus" /LENGTH=167 /DNA_ID=CAMNT_0051664593 /DNA_START=128 /DNA_END=631 /DNA_ORIENTATION=-
MFISKAIAQSHRLIAVAGRTATKSVNNGIHIRCLSSESITYSGGQACTGQGGYYGSGGARAKATPSVNVTQEQRSKMIGLAEDVEKISIVMDEVDVLQSLLDDDREASDGEVTSKNIELRGQMKRLVSDPQFSECLDRLEVEGAPVWGLSSKEHEMILLAREKINSC